jgi:glycosyltransferase involved in cell wall biosynthesis
MPIPSIEQYRLQLSQTQPLEKKDCSLSEHLSKKNYSDRPLVSIITIVYNAEQSLESTIQCVISQTYPNIEYIIVDGGSRDKTLEIVQKYDRHINYWRSEKDGGLYDALNRGIALATGEIIGLIHAGDNYTPDAVASIVDLYLQDPSPALIIGNCQQKFRDNSQGFIRLGNSVSLPYKTLPHPPTFVVNRVYQEVGLFDTSLKIASDYDFFCRCYNHKIKFVHLNKQIASASFEGVSGNYYLTAKEELKVRLRNNLSFLKSLKIYLFALVTITGHTILEYLGLWHLIETRRNGSIR